MSKLFQNNPNKLFSKSYRSNQNNINQSVQDIIDLYSQSSSYINNHNNITIDYPRHYSPNYRSPPSLPSISNRKPGHSLERGNISDKKSLFNNANESSILSNIGSNIINNQNQRLKRDKTQIMLLGQNNNSILPQINNITNINIHIYPNVHNHGVNNSVSYNTTKKKKILRGNIKVNNLNKKMPNTIPAEIAGDINNINGGTNMENGNNQDNNLNNIDNSVKFLRDISNDSSSFELFLQLIQCHIDLELLCDNIMGGHTPFRRKTTTNITNEMLFRLSKLLNLYFNILHSIYFSKDSFFLGNINDSFFTFPWLNQTFHRVIKVQMCIYSSIMITMTQLGMYEINTVLKNHFHKIIKEISHPLYNFFQIFAFEEININYSDVIQKCLRPDFIERFSNLYNSEYKVNKGYKNSECLLEINKNIDKCINSMKYYSTLNLKYSLIKPYGDSITQMLNSIDRKPINIFAKIILSTILYGELDMNKNAMLAVTNRSNNINTTIPYLPPISKEYKYTLVLDMDETLVHFFFTHLSGMFFVRPYCFEFLNELNSMYEIVTFTAGTKDYADGILNQLDKNGDIIKYRLYRQHTSISGCNVYKDLNKLGRELSKTIIIDNLKENFKMQPNNGIFIKTWTSDVNDTQFRDLKKILKDIFILNVSDVRVIIQKMNEEIRLQKNLLNPYSGIDITKYV